MQLSCIIEKDLSTTTTIQVILSIHTIIYMKMNIFNKIAAFVLISFVLLVPGAYCQELPFEEGEPEISTSTPSGNVVDTYYKAKILRVIEEGTIDVEGKPQEYQKFELLITNGDKKGQHIFIDHGLDFVIGKFKKYKEGQQVVVAHPPETAGALKNFYYIIDDYRIPSLFYVAIVFFILAIYFGRKRGVTSILGMIFSVFIIFSYVIPNIIKGSDPFLTCIAGGVVIVLISLYLSHGINRRTTIALVSTLLALGLAILIDVSFVYIAKLSGTGTEESFFLLFDNYNINLRGLLLGGIIIGVLGVLDDVTTSQSAAVEEIHTANPALGFKELYQKGLSVGREHIASLINTLVLAYVGASFPLLLLFNTQKYQPLWVTINSDFLAEEIVRTLVGSSTLVIAVPLTTALSAYFHARRKIKKIDSIEKLAS